MSKDDPVYRKYGITELTPPETRLSDMAATLREIFRPALGAHRAKTQAP
jgi:hypothetical protein